MQDRNEINFKTSLLTVIISGGGGPIFFSPVRMSMVCFCFIQNTASVWGSFYSDSTNIKKKKEVYQTFRNNSLDSSRKLSVAFQDFLNSCNLSHYLVMMVFCHLAQVKVLHCSSWYKPGRDPKAHQAVLDPILQLGEAPGSGMHGLVRRERSKSFMLDTVHGSRNPEAIFTMLLSVMASVNCHA